MTPVAVFEQGQQMFFRGMQWTVLGGHGQTVILRPEEGNETPFNVFDILQDPSFVPYLRVNEEGSPERRLLNTLSLAEKVAVLEKEALVLEVTTGYRSGRAELALSNEPREGYDPQSTKLMNRYILAAQETGRSVSGIRRLCQMYRKHGLAGLIDHRTEGRRGSQWDTPEMQAAVEQVSKEAVRQSTVTRKVHISRLRRLLQDKHKNVKLPSTRSLYRLMDSAAYKYHLDGQATTRRSRANSPQRMHHQVVASRLGEYVMLDASPWDVLLRSIHHPDEARRYRMLVALDLYHRGIVGFSLHAGEPQAVDTAYLLYDTLHPKTMLPGWPEDMRYPYVGIPESVIVEAHHLMSGTKLTAQGFVVPSNITIDNGKIFTSRVFLDTCRRLGISVIFSRHYTPTDKGANERFFSTVEKDFAAHLPGFVGQNVAHRGEMPPLETLLWVDEFQDKFFQYYTTVYMKRPHKGLIHPEFPKRPLTPAQMFELGLSTGGLVRVPLDRDIYYQLLPTITRLITSSGVEAFGLQYDHNALDQYRRDGRQHTFAHDPRDLRYLYFRDSDGQWLQLHRKPAQFPELPFTTEMLRTAKEPASEGMRHTPEQTNARLDAIIRDLETTARTRRKATQRLTTRQEGTAAARRERIEVDRARTQAPQPIPPSAPKPPTEPATPTILNKVTFAIADDETDLAELFND